MFMIQENLTQSLPKTNNQIHIRQQSKNLYGKQIGKYLQCNPGRQLIKNIVRLKIQIFMSTSLYVEKGLKKYYGHRIFNTAIQQFQEIDNNHTYFLI